jgi:nitrite reductase/ring-hydroxylating ferredoxin subunit
VAEQPLIAVCESQALVDGGAGVRFEVSVGGYPATGFVVRFRGRAVGYLNRCSHVAMELDWLPGAFFDADGDYLMCATHGALYDPVQGACVAGPCTGRGGLRKLHVEERDGHVWWSPDDTVPAPPGPAFTVA